jgi:hypothetical protein
LKGTRMVALGFAEEEIGEAFDERRADTRRRQG